MCDYCKGKSLLNHDTRVDDPSPYGGSIRRTNFKVQIDRNNLILHRSMVGNFRMIDSNEAQIKINYCPICGEKLDVS
jgi:hypothetical protein